MTNEDLSHTNNTFITIVKSPLRFKLFLLKKLPMALLTGLRIASADANQASVLLSLNYLTKNPFHSIYFACQAMAAELSTGILAMNAIEQSSRKFSILVVHLEADFIKKATGTVVFKSEDGNRIKQTVNECINQSKSQQIVAKSIGRDQAEEIVAKFSITWSFKPKKN